MEWIVQLAQALVNLRLALLEKLGQLVACLSRLTDLPLSYVTENQKEPRTFLQTAPLWIPLHHCSLQYPV